VNSLRNDRILPLTRLVSACIPPFLIAAFAILYLFPGRTKELFAWTIRPDMTPLLMGAGYVAGTYFFGRLVLSGRDGRWHHYAYGFVAITAFTWFMLGATVLHLDRFNQDHVSFFAWTALYVITPVVVPSLWLYNRRTDPQRLEPGDLEVPSSVRAAGALAGAGMLGVAIFLFTAPASAADVWPWAVSPLTARVLAGWFALPGTLGLALSQDRRWSAWRTPLASQAIGLALILLAVPRAWGDFETGRITTWLFLGGITSLLAFVVVLHFRFESMGGKQVRA
jgi:hypothetical protein